MEEGNASFYYNAFFEATSAPRSRCDKGATTAEGRRKDAASHRFSVWPLSLLTSSSSEEDTTPSVAGDSTAPSSSPRNPGQRILDASSFERVEWADRYADPQHAIKSTLTGPTMIEAYELYRPRGENAEGSEAAENAPTDDKLVVVARVRFGTHLNGHGGVVHGGILGLLLDDAIGCGCYEAVLSVLPEAFHKTIVTANLSIDYRRPVPEATQVLIEVFLERWEGRKFYLRARMIDAEEQDETTTGGDLLYAEATSLYILLKDQK